MVRSILAIRLLCVAIGVIAMLAGNAYSSSINGSTIDVSGLGSTTKAVTVSLHNFSATNPSDVDVVVVGPTGTALVLMGGVAGTSQVEFVSVTFDDTAPANLISQHLTTGSFKPTQVGPIGSFPSPGPGLAYDSPSPAGTSILVTRMQLAYLVERRRRPPTQTEPGPSTQWTRFRGTALI